MNTSLTLTPEQHRAVHTDGQDILVQAGAGSGKTRVLVERYIRLLREGHTVYDLVAITFTEKAAREMRDRVRRALEELRRQEPHNPRWRDLYLQLADARIGTIHAFCARLLREYAAEAELDPDFEILDEIDSDIVLEEVVENAAIALAETDHETAFTLFDIYDPFQVQRTLKTLLRQPDTLDALQRTAETLPPDDLPADVLRRLDTHPDYTKLKTALANLRQALDLGPPDDKLYNKVRELVEHAEAAETALADTDLDALITALRGCATLKFGNYGKKEAWQQAGLDKNDVRHSMQMLKDAAEALCETLLAAEEARLLRAWARAARLARDMFTAEKRTRPALDFDDLEIEAARLLTKPDVADDVRAHIAHILVDEFQDTNTRQLAIVQALRGAPNQGRLFVVGDAKQSIYAFRNADVRAFLALADEITTHGGLTIELNRSFRTHKALVERFNALFAPLFDDENAEQVPFQPLDAHRPTPAAGKPPFVRCIAFDKPRNIDITTVRRQEAETIAARIACIVREAWPVGREPHPATYGDIAILFRATSDIALYEDALKNAGIPFLTIAGRGFFDRREVRDLLSLLRAVEDPHDAFSILAALRSPLFGVSDAALFHLRLDEQGQPRAPFALLSDEDAFAALLERLSASDRDHLRHARDVLMRLRHLSGRVTLFELIREALDATDYLATLSLLPDGERQRSNVEKLVAFVRTRRLTSLRRFNRTIEDLNTRDVREGEAVLEAENAVRLMTIHAAKGLEFPIVFLADAGRSTNPRYPQIVSDGEQVGVAWTHPLTGEKLEGPRFQAIRERLKQREEAESMRLLYVALTRAEEYVFITGHREGWVKKVWDLLDETEKELVEVTSA